MTEKLPDCKYCGIALSNGRASTFGLFVAEGDWGLYCPGPDFQLHLPLDPLSELVMETSSQSELTKEINP